MYNFYEVCISFYFIYILHTILFNLRINLADKMYILLYWVLLLGHRIDQF